MITPIHKDKHLFINPKREKNNRDWSSIMQEAAANAIESLDLSYCSFTQIQLDNPDGILLPSLRVLDISYNQNPLQKVHLNGDLLPNLQHLYLYKSQIQQITFEGSFPRLETLHLAENELKEFSFINFPKLKTLYLYKNPLTSIPKDIYDEERKNVWQGVRNYLQALATGSMILQRAKLILIGNGSAGKTTLSHQLRTGEFVEIPEADRTHGIKIENWDISQKDFSHDLKDKIQKSISQAQKDNPQANKQLQLPENLSLTLWDFGGQEYYHATHRLFLNSNALYLLLWEQTTNYQDEGKGLYPLEHWWDNIRYYAPQNITLEIQNKVQGNFQFNQDELKFSLADRKLDIEEYEYHVKRIQKAIFSQLHKLTLGESFPKIYDDILNALTADTRPVLTFEEYENLCREIDKTPEKIMQSESQIQTLTELLHDTGAIICYKYQKEPLIDAELKKYVFIKPQAVTAVIYDILHKDLQGIGEFDKEYLENALKRSPEYQKYKTEWENSNLDWGLLMKAFELIFEVEKDGEKLFVAPQYLPKNFLTKAEAKKMQEAGKQLPIGFPVAETVNAFLKKRDLIHSFTLKFPKYIPNSLFLRFIARYGSQSKDEYYYCKTAIAFFNKEEKIAFVSYKQQENDHLIEVKTEKGADDLVQEIYRFFVDKGNEHTQVSPNGSDFFLCQGLQEKTHKNERQSMNGKWLANMEFCFLGLQEHKPKAKKIFFSYSKEDRAYLDKLLKALHPLKRNEEIVPWDDSQLVPGEDWDAAIKAELEDADIILLLVSPDFLATDYIWKVEIEKAMERHRNGSSIVIPVFVRPCLWTETPFNALTGIPNPKKTISQYNEEERDAVYLQVTQAIQKVIEG